MTLAQRKTVLFIAGLVVACGMVAGTASAQYSSAVRPRYEAYGPHSYFAVASSSSKLAQWNGSFTDLTHVKRTFTMVGADPSKSNATTTIPVVIVPIKMVYGPSNGNKTFDPTKNKFPDGQTILQTVLASPLFQAAIDFKQGGTDLGKSQYIDAFQRANFWGKNVSKNTKYHVLLGKPVVLPAETIKVSSSQGSVKVNPISGHGLVGIFDANTMDQTLQGYMNKLKQIQPNVLPLFVTYDIYLADSFGCCIGGYHGAVSGPPNGQTYSYTTVVDQGTNEFAQDISAMSHELGEWMDNPFFGTNTVGCQDNSQLEVGDPLENNPNFGAFPYKIGKFTYNLQSLVFLDYFGASPKTDLHKWLSFQNDKKTVCPGQ